MNLNFCNILRQESLKKHSLIMAIARKTPVGGLAESHLLVNDTEEAIGSIADFIRCKNNVRYELLKYHRLGESKYASLHRMYPMGDVELSEETFRRLKQFEFNNISSQLEDEGWQKGLGI